MVMIVFFLGSGLRALIKNTDKDSMRMVKALTWRIGLSLLLFILLFLGFYFGLIQPHGL